MATGDDRVTFFWRDEKSAEVHAWRQDCEPEPLGGVAPDERDTSPPTALAGGSHEPPGPERDNDEA